MRPYNFGDIFKCLCGRPSNANVQHSTAPQRRWRDSERGELGWDPTATLCEAANLLASEECRTWHLAAAPPSVAEEQRLVSSFTSPLLFLCGCACVCLRNSDTLPADHRANRICSFLIPTRVGANGMRGREANRWIRMGMSAPGSSRGSSLLSKLVRNVSLMEFLPSLD